ncbi:hypothetical protein Patl1_09683 [Pistacia atlantica]|uniref:Uncharacterized protein n=1 Tax=Pistacia atlantica TaxID=434234 RepID=A0ACC1A530_9ROSI|nr:hypothetical protein Patl1_09683 [Pistacia atlantica]
MGRESNDTIIIQSSIALLQERFRQLQRVKEMREEREQNKVLIQPKLFDTPMHYKLSPSNSRLFFHFLPPRSSSSYQQLQPHKFPSTFGLILRARMLIFSAWKLLSTRHLLCMLHQKNLMSLSVMMLILLFIYKTKNTYIYTSLYIYLLLHHFVCNVISEELLLVY